MMILKLSARLPAIAILLCLSLPVTAGEPGLVGLSKIDRTIAKEPTYKGEPHYGLLVFGPKAEQRSWLVVDGHDVLYVDRNGNGDLTDAEDRIELDLEATRKLNVAPGGGVSAMNIFPIGTVAGVRLQLDMWVRVPGFVYDNPLQRKWAKEREEHRWENSSLIRYSPTKGGSQIPIILTASPAEAQITHLEGPLTFDLKWRERQRLQPWPRQSTFDIHIGTTVLPPRHYTHKLFAPLSEWDFPRDVHPIAVFEFAPKSPGGKPVVKTVELSERCCGDTAYVQFTVPHEAGPGPAKVTLTYSKWTKGVVIPATFELPIGTDPDGHEPATSFVMFGDPEKSIGLNEALTALRVAGLSVQKLKNGDQEALQIARGERGVIAVALNRKPEVLVTAKALGEGSAFAAALARCDSRFEIAVHPASFLKEEAATLAKIEAALLEETQGILYTADGELVYREARRINDPPAKNKATSAVDKIEPSRVPQIEPQARRTPTDSERLAESIARAMPNRPAPDERFAIKLRDARLADQRLLLFATAKESAACRDFFKMYLSLDDRGQYTEANRAVQKALGDYTLLAIDTSNPEIREAARPLFERLKLEMPTGGGARLAVLDVDGRVLEAVNARQLASRTAVSAAELQDRPQVRAGGVSAAEIAASSLDGMKLIALLKKHAPVVPDAEQIYADALDRARREEKLLLVRESGAFCGPCVLLSRFLDEHKEVFAKDYVSVKLDRRFTNGGQVIDRIRKESGGIPWMVILDADENPLVTSTGPEGNTGHPMTPVEIAHFETMLRTTARRLTEADIQMLIEALRRDELNRKR